MWRWYLLQVGTHLTDTPSPDNSVHWIWDLISVHPCLYSYKTPPGLDHFPKPSKVLNPKPLNVPNEDLSPKTHYLQPSSCLDESVRLPTQTKNILFLLLLLHLNIV